MKKLSIVMAIVLCVSACFCMSVSAANPEVELYVTALGTDLMVSIESSSNLGAISGVIGYDKGAITYDSSVVNASISSVNSTSDTFSNSAGEGQTSVALVGDSSNGTSGNWATIGYVAPLGTPIDFSLTNFKAFNKNGAATKTDFAVIVLGDVNEDKVVDITDYVRFTKIFKDNASLPAVEKCLDVNRSGGDYSIGDLSQLRKNLLAG